MRFRDLRSLALALTLAIAALTPAAARAQDYTDIWWNAGGTESGWGVNFVQNEDIIYATFYIYDVNRQPIWYSAAMTRTGSGAYAGPLYQTAGSFFGNAWNPAEHPAAALVGSSTFTPSTTTTGTLNYSVTTGPNTGAASKQIVRFAFKTILLGGNYSGVMSETVSNCQDSTNNHTGLIIDIDPQVTQTTGGQLQIIVPFSGSTDSCTLSGPRGAGGAAVQHADRDLHVHARRQHDRKGL